jgi:hypothetical protein
MNCHDAREQFPALVAGMSSLSEWAPVEAHVGKCADCRTILETLYRTKSRNEPGWARPSPKSVDEPDESTRILEVVSPSRRPHRHALWAVLVAAAVTLGAGAWLAGYGSQQSVESALVALLERLQSGIHQAEVLVAPARPLVSAPPVAPPRNSPPDTAPAPPPSPPAATVPTPPVPPLASTRPESPSRNNVPQTAAAPPRSSVPEIAAAPPRSNVPEIAAAPPRSNVPETAAAPPRSSVPETAAAPPRSSVPETRAVPRPSPPAAEPKTIRPTKEVPAPASLPSRVSKSPRSIPDKSAAVTKPTPEAAPDPSSLVEIGKIDVAVQLSVGNRKDAERDLGMLLARVGGTKLGSGQTSTLTASVPRSSYSEFTRGLSQIGSWRLEAGRSSLPDPIHVAVKLAK